MLRISILSFIAAISLFYDDSLSQEQSDQSKRQEAWIEMLLAVDENRTNVGEMFAVTIESDIFREDYNDDRSVLSGVSRRMIVVKHKDDTLYCEWTFHTPHRPETDSGTFIVNLQHASKSYRFHGTGDLLSSLGSIREDDRPAIEIAAERKFFDPFFLPCATHVQWGAGLVNSKFMDNYAERYECVFLLQSPKHSIMRVTKGGAILQFKVDQRNGLPIQLLWRSKPRDQPNAAWEKCADYCITETKWEKAGDYWRPSHCSLGLNSLGKNIRGLDHVATDSWNFYWLDPKHTRQLTEPSILEILKRLPKTPGVLVELPNKLDKALEKQND